MFPWIDETTRIVAADSRQWIASLTQLIEFKAKFVITGHGPASTDPKVDLVLTRDYLLHLR